MKAYKKKFYIIPIVICLLAIAAVVAYYLTGSFSRSEQREYVYIDDNDNLDSVTAKLAPIASEQALLSFKIISHHTGYDKNIRSGRFAIEPGEGTISVLRKLKNGHQEPMRLTIPESRTTDRLAGAIGRKLMMDSLSLRHDHDSLYVCAQHLRSVLEHIDRESHEPNEEGTRQVLEQEPYGEGQCFGTKSRGSVHACQHYR